MWDRGRSGMKLVDWTLNTFDDIPWICGVKRVDIHASLGGNGMMLTPAAVAGPSCGSDIVEQVMM